MRKDLIEMVKRQYNSPKNQPVRKRVPWMMMSKAQLWVMTGKCLPRVL